ncbi:hypothetical protein EFU53_000589 [Vibrio cholerae]|uniref:Acb2/Tad1 domain-containing protein n=1 Tax=Vibrio cholerae TaxID=666 RepID=UPI0004E39B19|nr:hypothetical protein [Vibrio cholerae]EKF9564382.1 hypothetical protein [Vibrio cholerae]KFE28234.1 hypothetical protein DN30_1211 [Vibrio cholerae]NOE09449.1 hypothetical protein [Vibrio cholerae]TXY40881.1 hypothetical protein FXE84_17585 [Vibrio cholerae]
MDNQHRKIKGYRDLSQKEIDLMNRIKEHGEQTKALIDELLDLRNDQQLAACEGTGTEISYQQALSSIRCLQLAKDNLQTGQMWLVRAVALPESF